MSRAYNRHALDKAKNRAKRYLKIIDRMFNGELANDKRMIGKHATARKLCDCQICKNERYNRAKEKHKEE